MLGLERSFLGRGYFLRCDFKSFRMFVHSFVTWILKCFIRMLECWERHFFRHENSLIYWAAQLQHLRLMVSYLSDWELESWAHFLMPLWGNFWRYLGLSYDSEQLSSLLGNICWQRNHSVMNRIVPMDRLVDSIFLQRKRWEVLIFMSA